MPWDLILNIKFVLDYISLYSYRFFLIECNNYEFNENIRDLSRSVIQFSEC